MRRLQKVAGSEERPVLKRKLWGKGEGSLRLLNHLRRMAGLKERGEKMERDNQRRRQNFTTTSVIKSQRPAQQTVILIEVCPSCETTTKNVSSVQRITSVLRGGRLEETCVILGGTDPRTVFFIYISSLSIFVPLTANNLKFLWGVYLIRRGKQSGCGCGGWGYDTQSP